MGEKQGSCIIQPKKVTISLIYSFPVMQFMMTSMKATTVVMLFYFFNITDADRRLALQIVFSPSPSTLEVTEVVPDGAFYLDTLHVSRKNHIVLIIS